MTNFVMTEGIERNRKLRIAKRIGLAVLVGGLAVLWLMWSNNNDKKVMDIHYCWDSQGQHFVSPNINCWNN